MRPESHIFNLWLLQMGACCAPSQKISPDHHSRALSRHSSSHPHYNAIIIFDTNVLMSPSGEIHPHVNEALARSQKIACVVALARTSSELKLIQDRGYEAQFCATAKYRDLPRGIRELRTYFAADIANVIYFTNRLQAADIVRAEGIWTTFIATGMGITPNDIDTTVQQHGKFLQTSRTNTPLPGGKRRSVDSGQVRNHTPRYAGGKRHSIDSI